VRIVVSGVNPTDWKSLRGAIAGDPLPFAEVGPNRDGAGVVDAVGPGVEHFHVGDTVWLAWPPISAPTAGHAAIDMVGPQSSSQSGIRARPSPGGIKGPSVGHRTTSP
jgi:NADPH:quinone reductase-like Zn-dependent oxidoreductase